MYELNISIDNQITKSLTLEYANIYRKYIIYTGEIMTDIYDCLLAVTIIICVSAIVLIIAIGLGIDI